MVFIRLSQKILTLFYNYRKSSFDPTPKLPKKVTGLFMALGVILITSIAIVTYFFNKHASLGSLVNKIGGGSFLHMLTYIISIWALVSTSVSLYPATWHLLGKIRARDEEKEEEYFSEIVPRHRIRGLEKQGGIFKTGLFKIDPEKTNDLTLETSESKNLKNIEEGQSFKLIQKVKGKTIYYYNAIKVNNKVKIITKNYTSCKGIRWYLHSLLKSKNAKIPITFLDYFADIPFLLFAIYYSNMPVFITTILTVCMPFGLIECILFNLHYFFREQKISMIGNTKFGIAKHSCKSKSKIKLSKKAFRIYFFLMFTSLISASSKFFARFFPIYHVSIATGINYNFSVVFAAVFSTIYMLRNIANMLNTRETIKYKIANYINSSEISQAEKTTTSGHEIISTTQPSRTWLGF